MSECKNCKLWQKKLFKARKQRDDKEEELIRLSREYTKALDTINYLNKVKDREDMVID